MSGRRWLWVLAVGAAAASSACSDSVGPTPLQKKASLAKPTGASFGRYILISGVVTCVEECDDDSGPAQSAEGLPVTGPDTLGLLSIPVDTSNAP